MTKPILRNMPTSTQLSEAESNMLMPDNINVSIKNGIRTVEGFNANGEKVVIETILSNDDESYNSGFRQKTMTVCDNLEPEERRNIAKKLKKEQKLSQIEIAKRLGVSQKTISNDLKK